MCAPQDCEQVRFSPRVHGHRARGHKDVRRTDRITSRNERSEVEARDQTFTRPVDDEGDDGVPDQNLDPHQPTWRPTPRRLMRVGILFQLAIVSLIILHIENNAGRVHCRSLALIIDLSFQDVSPYC